MTSIQHPYLSKSVRQTILMSKAKLKQFNETSFPWFTIRDRYMHNITYFSSHCAIKAQDYPYIYRVLIASGMIVLLNTSLILTVFWLIRTRERESATRLALLSRKVAVAIPARTAVALVIQRSLVTTTTTKGKGGSDVKSPAANKSMNSSTAGGGGGGSSDDNDLSSHEGGDSTTLQIEGEFEDPKSRKSTGTSIGGNGRVTDHSGALRRASVSLRSFAHVISRDIPSTLYKARDRQRLLVVLAVFDIFDGAGFLLSFIDALAGNHSFYAEIVGSFLIYSGYLCSSLLIVFATIRQARLVVWPLRSRLLCCTCSGAAGFRASGRAGGLGKSKVMVSKSEYTLAFSLGVTLSVIAHVFRYTPNLVRIYLRTFIYAHVTFGFCVQSIIILGSIVILAFWYRSRQGFTGKDGGGKINESDWIRSDRMLRMGMTAVQIGNFSAVLVVLATHFMSLRRELLAHDVIGSQQPPHVMTASECWEIVMPYTAVALMYGMCRPICFFFSLAAQKLIEHQTGGKKTGGGYGGARQSGKFSVGDTSRRLSNVTFGKNSLIDIPTQDDKMDKLMRHPLLFNHGKDSQKTLPDGRNSELKAHNRACPQTLV